MMISKLEVELLAVGQGSCNVIKGLDTTGGLKYLAILDAGGSGTGKSPAKEALALLKGYMKERARIMRASAPADHYADHLLVSHGDDDHYSIILKLALSMNPFVTQTGKKKEKIAAALKKKAVTSFRSLGNPEEEDAEDSFVDFAFYEYGYDGDFYYDYYIYQYHAQDDQRKNIYYKKKITVPFAPSSKQRIVECVENFAYGIRTGSDFYEGTCLLQRYMYNEIQLWFPGVYEIPFSMDKASWKMASITLGEDNVTVDVHEFRIKRVHTFIINKKFDQSMGLYNILEFLSLATEAPSWFSLVAGTIFTGLKTAMVYLDARYEDVPNFSISLKDIDENLTVGHAENPGDAAPKPDTLRFGEVTVSAAKDCPDPISFLKLHTVAPATPATPDNLYFKTLINPDPDPAYYKTIYGGDGKQNKSFDDNFRNLNSIITIVGLNGVKPHFVFPGDATVQNMWFNAINIKKRGKLLRGEGCNYLALPHHGAYETSHGEYLSGTKIVFLEFLKKVDPAEIYISAGYHSHHGHPNIWTMNQVNKYFVERTSSLTAPKHALHYNKTNDKPDSAQRVSAFLFCHYERPLYGTIALEALSAAQYKVQAHNYRMTFSGATLTPSVFNKTDLSKTIATASVRDFSSLGSGFPDTVKPRLPDHPIYDFIMRT